MLTLEFKVDKKLPFVFEYLSDMQKFASVHPVISKIEATDKNNYKVYETLKFGIVPFSFTYDVTVEQNAMNNQVVFRAVVFKITKVTMHFELSAHGDSTIVKEKIEFETPLPIKSIMKRVFSEQHTLLFENIGKA